MDKGSYHEEGDGRSQAPETVPMTSVQCPGSRNGSESDRSDRSEEYRRGQWSSRLDYLLSMVGYCVGFGNLWRFPYICNRNGGGAFLIPFLFFLVITAFPMFYLESCLGQFSGKGAIHVWNFCPLFKGIGIGAVLQVMVCLPYYNVLLAWPIYYMIKSCSSVLPWTTCGNSWNTDLCVEDIDSLQRSLTNYSLQESLINSSLQNSFNSTLANPSIVLPEANISVADMWKNRTLSHSAVEEFYQYNVLGISEGLHEVGSMQWHVLGCLFASYVIIFLCLFRGVKATGKVVYVTALLPYILLTVIFIRVMTLPGAVDGLVYYIQPDFSKLLHAQVWLEACIQVFYSLGPGWGIITTSSSYNRFNEPLLRDSVILCAASEGTSIFAGFVTFSVLGVMAKKLGVAISKVVSSGPGLGFVAYTEALSRLPLPQLWAFLFFLMLLTVGLDSQFLFAEIVSTAIIDQFPHTLGRRRTLVTAGLCGVSFLLGCIICTQGGPYIFQLLDWYLVAMSLFIYCTVECVAAVWIYGIHQLDGDIEMMMGRQLPLIVKILWAFVTPLLLMMILFVTLSQYKPPTYGSYVYPHYASVLGWFVALVPVLPIPIFMVRVIASQKGGSLAKKLNSSILPDDTWAPIESDFAFKYREKLVRNRRTLKEKLSYIFTKPSKF